MTNTDYLAKVGKTIHHLRVKAGFKSSETFANYHGINRTSCYRMEQGKNITLVSLIKIAECHNLTPAELLDWAEKMKKK